MRSSVFSAASPTVYSREYGGRESKSLLVSTKSEEPSPVADENTAGDNHSIGGEDSVGDSVRDAIVAWRITSRTYQEQAFEGEGARLYGGRWNSEGVPMTYLAGSLALAALEQMVHLGSAELVEGQFVRFRVTIPARCVLSLDRHALPGEGKSGTRHLDATRGLGDSWAQSKDSAVLRVPSAVVPEEDNYLLNPAHPAMEEINIGEPEPLTFDERLFR